MIRLLIADDERMEREALADIVMRRFEHEVTVEMAENGRKAADTAVLWEADLILMDIEMPGMNGLDAARAVLEQRPECKVIFITAYSLFQYAHEAVHLGACDYLLRPPSAALSGKLKPGAAWPSWLRKPRSRKPPRSRRPSPPGKGRATATHW
jgi:YesN/AraC family two-component response regulator